MWSCRLTSALRNSGQAGKRWPGAPEDPLLFRLSDWASLVALPSIVGKGLAPTLLRQAFHRYGRMYLDRPSISTLDLNMCQQTVSPMAPASNEQLWPLLDHINNAALWSNVRVRRGNGLGLSGNRTTISSEDNLRTSGYP